MKKEYIERTNAKLRFNYNDDYNGNVVKNILDYVPAADVAPVIHGEWVGKKYNWDYRWEQPKVKLEDCHYLECSNCGNRHPLYTYNVWTNCLTRCAVFDEKLKIPKYCSNCGAEMNGGNNEDNM